jgi:hypothetical protein
VEKREVAKMMIVFADPSEFEAEKLYPIGVCVGGNTFRVVIEEWSQVHPNTRLHSTVDDLVGRPLHEGIGRLGMNRRVP